MPVSSLSDHELLELLRNGDKAAFTEIYNRYWESMVAVATHKTGDLDEGEEIVQDIFVSLWNRRKDLRISGPLKNYLSVSVKYRVIKALAMQSNRREFDYPHSVDAAIIDDSTQEYLQLEELREQLSRLVAMLPEKCRLVYQLSRDAGYSQKEIASALSISEKTVEAHLGKALKTIRNGLNGFLLSLL